MLGADDIEESRIFYDKIMPILGTKPGKPTLNHDGHTRYVYFVNRSNSFLISEDPDIICLQEFQDNIINLSNYPYKFKFSKGSNAGYGQAIFSKFPIINRQRIDLASSSNNAIFVDLKIKLHEMLLIISYLKKLLYNLLSI